MKKHKPFKKRISFKKHSKNKLKRTFDLHIGTNKTKHKYTATLFYGVDAANNFGYYVYVVTGSGNTPSYYSSTAVAGTWWNGVAFAFGAQRNLVSMPFGVPFWPFFQASQQNAFTNQFYQYRYFRLSAIRTTITNMLVPWSNQTWALAGGTTNNYIVPATSNTITSMPDVYFAPAEYTGIGSQASPGGSSFTTIDYNYNNFNANGDCLCYGYPQRYPNAGIYRPHATDVKKPYSKKFRFNEMSYPGGPSYDSASTLTKTINTPGHWGQTFATGITDVFAYNRAQLINGSMMFGYMPQLSQANLPTFYSNSSIAVANIEFEFTFHWAGKFDFIAAGQGQ